MNKLAEFDRRTLTSPPFLLLVLGGLLMSIHLTLTFKVNNPDRQIAGMIFWAAAGYLIWERKHELTFKSGVGASTLGAVISIFLLLKSIGYCEESFLMMYPILAGIALALLASGFAGLKLYWRELTILFFLGIPELILTKLINPAPLTASFAASALWYSGMQIVQKGVFLNLPGGSVQVNDGCSGIVVMTQLLNMSALFLMLLPLAWKWQQKLILPILAVTIAFIVNVMRVALMALLVSQNQMEAFEYWHNGNGSLVFSAIATSLLVLAIDLLNKAFTRKPIQSSPPDESQT